MPRTFDGVDDNIVLSLGALGFAFGPGTIAAIVKRSADSTANSQMILHVGVSTGARYGLYISTTNILTLRTDTLSRAAPAGIDTCLVADGWLLVAATKAAGTVNRRYHRYEYATGVWQHATDIGTTQPSSSVPTTNANIGSDWNPSSFFQGDIAATGACNAEFTDSQIEALAYSLPAWFAVQPNGLWLLDQALTTQKVNDRSGGGADESAITGTSVGTSSLPVFSYGAAIQLALEYAVFAGTYNSLMMMGSGI